MRLLKTLLLLGTVLAAAPAAAHTYVYDDGAVRVIYNTHGYYGAYARDYYRTYYYPHAHSHRYYGHRHYRGCGHDFRHERHRHYHHRHRNRH